MELVQRWSSDKLKTSLNLKTWSLVTHLVFILNFKFEFLKIGILMFSDFLLLDWQRWGNFSQLCFRSGLPGARGFFIRELLQGSKVLKTISFFGIWKTSVYLYFVMYSLFRFCINNCTGFLNLTTMFKIIVKSLSKIQGFIFFLLQIDIFTQSSLTFVFFP